MKLIIVAVISAAIALSVVILTVGPAAAQTDCCTIIGQYINRNEANSDYLLNITKNDLNDRSTGLAFHISDLDPAKPEHVVVLGFFDTNAWNKFVQLWQNAIATKRTPGMAVAEIGEYFEDDDKVQLHVNVNDEGIELVVVGHDVAGGRDTGSLAIGDVHVLPAQLESFNADVSKVSAYFGNDALTQRPQTRQDQPPPTKGRK